MHLAPGRSRIPGLAACTQTSTVVLLGSKAGLTRVTLPGTGCATRHRNRRGVSRFQLRRFLLRNVGARNHLGQIHHRENRRAGGRHFARIDRPIRDDAIDRTEIFV